MKFGKVLKTTSENMPSEMHDLFLRYKELKKHIKAIPAREAPQERQGSVSASASASGSAGGSNTVTATSLSPEEQQFTATLNEDLARFNRFFMEKEEDAVIRLQALTDELAACSAAAAAEEEEAAAAAASGGSEAAPSARPAHEALQAAKAQLVQFHGEMVLLLHWSLLNYAAVVKILKKHDKRTGVLLRAPYLANVLQQPFSSTTIMSRLAKRAEELVVLSSSSSLAATHHQLQLLQNQPPPPAQPANPSEVAGVAPTAATEPSVPAPAAEASRADANAEELQHAAKDCQGPLVGRTMHALETWAALQRNAITPSTVLPLGGKEQQQAALGRKRKAEEAGVESNLAGAAHDARAGGVRGATAEDQHDV